MTRYRLYLASQSKARAHLLAEAGYTFSVIESSADERSVAWQKVPLQQLTQQLAQLKMDHVRIPVGGCEGDTCIVLTADTLCVDMHGIVQGKPDDFAHAARMVEGIKRGSTCGTGFCVDKRVWRNGVWAQEQRVIGYADAFVVFDIAPERVVHYFEQLKLLDGYDYLKLAGAFSIRGYGAQFVKEIRGSYSSIIGLPMYQVRCAFESVGLYV